MAIDIEGFEKACANFARHCYGGPETPYPYFRDNLEHIGLSLGGNGRMGRPTARLLAALLTKLRTDDPVDAELRREADELASLCLNANGYPVRDLRWQCSVCFKAGNLTMSPYDRPILNEEHQRVSPHCDGRYRGQILDDVAQISAADAP